MIPSDPARLMRLAAAVQGAYYVGTGIWSLVSIETFQMVTGPKTDLWLVKTVGVLVIVIGAALLLAAIRGSFPPEAVLLAAGSAVGLAAIDVTYVSIGRISPIYLLDALAEAVLAWAWVAAWRRARGSVFG